MIPLAREEVFRKLGTQEGFAELLGKSQGTGFRMKGRREIPQELYEFGFVEHDRTPVFSHTDPRDIRCFKVVVFDRGSLKGQTFEL